VEISDLFNQGNATELSYYPSLQNFLLAVSTNPNSKVIVNPSEEWGMPDFLVLDRESIIGYIEAKTPETDLDKVIESEQIQRYLDAFPNVILTNFIEFILLQDDKIEPIRIKLTSTFSLKKNQPITVNDDNLEELNNLFTRFLSFSSPPITNIEQLTNRLSTLTRVLKYILERYFNDKTESFKESILQDLFEGFKTTLIDNISGMEFCDVIAQTLSYSLLLAEEQQSRTKGSKKILNFDSAWQEIPKSLPVLIELFTLFMTKMPPDIKFCCESIIQLLNDSDLNKIFSFFGKKKEDPTIYFYEKFLESYNPELRKMKGSYYTPIPIVQFIVRSINSILKKSFRMSEGLMDEKIFLLDPCAGTLTFIIETIRLIHNILDKSNNLGRFEPIIKDHILTHYFAFEIMVAPYAIGHFKIREILKNLGVWLSSDDSFGFYLTNSLETKVHKKLPGFSALAKEYEKANDIKIKSPILVILGNPPYKIGSTNKTELITRLMKEYKPQPLKKGTQENLEPLPDDYIKFVRFAQWKIAEGSKEGIVAFITNNNFLRGRIHRKMRHSILKAFDEVLIYDLHGDSREEIPPKGKQNASVFGIRTGVCIFFLIKYHSEEEPSNKNKLAKVYYRDVWGNANEKLESLKETNIIKLLEKKGEKNELYSIVPDNRILFILFLLFFLYFYDIGFF
jgi:type I restriction-modification system DNA methylase subunit